VKAFFDTNILVYSMDRSEPRKRDMALAVMHRHMADGSLVVSTQVMLEFFNVMTRKHKASPQKMLAALEVLALNQVVSTGSDFALRAARLCATEQTATFDAAILQAALDSGCEVLYSEDFQAGRRYGALEVVNPFLLAAHEPMPPRPRGSPRRPVASRSQRL
jgi:predicted nucleic acid-binding protein